MLWDPGPSLLGQSHSGAGQPPNPLDLPSGWEDGERDAGKPGFYQTQGATWTGLRLEEAEGGGQGQAGVRKGPFKEKHLTLEV